MSLTNDELNDMGDEELEAAFKAARAEEDGGQEDHSEETLTEEIVEESVEESDSVDEIFDEEDNETAEDDQDENPESDEQDTEESTVDEAGDTEAASADEETPAAPVRRTFKANNKEYEFTDEEIMEQFPKVFGQAMDYTKKLQTIQPWRRTIDALEQAKINHQDVSLMIDVLQGDKEAIAAVLSRTGVDALDINTEESTYVEKEYGRSDGELAIVDVLDSIKDDPEYVTTHRVLTRDWDEASWGVLSGDPAKIRQLHIDVKSGMFDKLQPFAEKLRLYDGGTKSDLDYYLTAARNHYAAEEQANLVARQAQLQESERAKQAQAQTQVAGIRQQQQKREAVKQDASRRKAAAPSGRASARGTVTDYLTASEEDFEDWYKRLSDRE